MLVSCSARMLVQSAARAGIRTVALDHYADADTRADTDLAVAVARKRGEFDRKKLLALAARLAPPSAYPLVFGSGLDSRPGLLEELSRDRLLIGNTPRVQRLFREPGRFFHLLRQLGIAHPEIRFDRPPDPEQWLIKSGCSEGGKRVRFCAHDRAGSRDYYQRRLQGPAFSALFLADGQQAAVLGFNTLWSAALPGLPYLFVGAINDAPLTQAQRNRIETAVGSLVEAGELRGLNSLDFMLDDHGEPLVLEINARPSATMALHDSDFPEGLLAAHIRAFRGHIEPLVSPTGIRAFQVMFSPTRFTMTSNPIWPTWCSDLPVAGSVLARGQPLCTVGAEGNSAAAVRMLLEKRMAELHSLCFGPNRPNLFSSRPPGD